MKKSLLALMMILGTSTQALSAELLWDCDGTSDPDYVNVAVYKEDEKLYMVIQEFYGDGDSYDEDVVLVERIARHNVDFAIYAQVPGKYPRSKLAKKATKKTESAVLRIDLTKENGDHSIAGLTSPSGNELSENHLVCKKAAKK